MKNIAYVLSAVLLIAGCSSEKNQDEPIQEKTQEVEKIVDTKNPAEVIQAFKNNGLPIGEVLVHTAESDPNTLMGRPEGYIAFAHFEDTNVEQMSPDADDLYPMGGSVEIWKTQEEAEARKSYLEEVTKMMNMSPLKQYRYVNKEMLLRLEYDIRPDQAKKYEEVFNSFN